MMKFVKKEKKKSSSLLPELIMAGDKKAVRKING